MRLEVTDLSFVMAVPGPSRPAGLDDHTTPSPVSTAIVIDHDVQDLDDLLKRPVSIVITAIAITAPGPGLAASSQH
jgi:hypothetical protein